MVDDGDRVVHRLFELAPDLFVRVALDPLTVVRDVLRWQPGLAAVHRTPQPNLDLPPVFAAVSSGLAIGEHRPWRSDDDPGNSRSHHTVESGRKHHSRLGGFLSVKHAPKKKPGDRAAARQRVVEPRSI